MKRSVPNGLLITIEGIDGSGKSTLAHNLAARLEEENYDVILTKEPGGSALGKQLRTILQTQPVPITPLAEFLLFAADRAQHFKDIIIPNLQKGKILISDRMADSSIVYQGYGRGLDIDKIMFVNSWVMQEIEPNFKFYVRVTPEEASKRIQSRNSKLTAFEKEHAEFTKRLASGFEAIYKNAQLVESYDQIFHEQTYTNSNVYILEGMYTPETLTQQAYKLIHSWITQQQLQ